MRPYEDYVKKSLEKYLSDKDYLEIIEGEDPPDYYVIFKDNKILLEVTRAEPIYRGENSLENRNTNEIALLRLCDQLNNELGSEIKPKRTLSLWIQGPIVNYNKFKISIKQKLLLIIKDKEFLKGIYNEWKDVDIEGNRIQIRLDISSPERKRICGYVGIINNKSIINIDEQASLILANRLTDKEEKTKYINKSEWHGEKWLAIYNGYFLASPETYIGVIQRINIPHTFTKIFIIEDDYKVTEIFGADY